MGLHLIPVRTCPLLDNSLDNFLDNFRRHGSHPTTRRAGELFSTRGVEHTQFQHVSTRSFNTESQRLTQMWVPSNTSPLGADLSGVDLSGAARPGRLLRSPAIQQRTLCLSELLGRQSTFILEPYQAF